MTYNNILWKHKGDESTMTTNNTNQKTETNDLARDIFETQMTSIGAEIVYTPKISGENYIVRHRGRNLKVRVRGTEDKNVPVYLIRANRTWFESEYAPDFFYIVSGVKYYSKKIHVVSARAAKSNASIQTVKSDKAVSYILSYNNVKKLDNTEIF